LLVIFFIISYYLIFICYHCELDIDVPSSGHRMPLLVIIYFLNIS